MAQETMSKEEEKLYTNLFMLLNKAPKEKLYLLLGYAQGLSDASIEKPKR